MPSSNYYTGPKEIGFSKYNRVELPKTVPCMICKKFKPHDCFSNKQLNDLKQKVSRSGRASITTTNSIRCFQCTGAQNTEMYCILCQTTKPLRGFALAQRRNPDAAKCLLCMDAQALVLPIDRSDLAQFDGDDEEEQKQRDAWERDPYTGEYKLKRDAGNRPGVPGSAVTGSSRELSGFNSASQSISGYSAVSSSFRSKKKENTVGSDTTGQGGWNGGVKINTQPTRAGNATPKLTPGNLANVEDDPSHSMNKLRIEDPWSQDESEGESVAAPSVSTVHAPAKGSVSGFSSITQQAYDASSDEEDDDGRRPVRVPPNRVQESYTATDQHGNRHPITDTASVASSRKAPPSSVAQSTGGWTTVSSAHKISHSGFDLRDKPTDPNNRRKFARVRPQNLATERIQEGLLHRIDEEGGGRRPTNVRKINYYSDEDEDY